MFYNPFSILRSLVYLKRISLSLVRIADALDRSNPPIRRSKIPTQFGVASVEDWNERYYQEREKGDHIPKGVEEMKGPNTY